MEEEKFAENAVERAIEFEISWAAHEVIHHVLQSQHNSLQEMLTSELERNLTLKL